MNTGRLVSAATSDAALASRAVSAVRAYSFFAVGDLIAGTKRVAFDSLSAEADSIGAARCSTHFGLAFTLLAPLLAVPLLAFALLAKTALAAFLLALAGFGRSGVLAVCQPERTKCSGEHSGQRPSPACLGDPGFGQCVEPNGVHGRALSRCKADTSIGAPETLQVVIRSLTPDPVPFEGACLRAGCAIRAAHITRRLAPLIDIAALAVTDTIA
jgi:hypothetical protein